MHARKCVYMRCTRLGLLKEKRHADLCLFCHTATRVKLNPGKIRLEIDIKIEMKSSMVFTGLFWNGPFEMRPEPWPSRPGFGFPVRWPFEFSCFREQAVLDNDQKYVKWNMTPKRKKNSGTVPYTVPYVLCYTVHELTSLVTVCLCVGLSSLFSIISFPFFLQLWIAHEIQKFSLQL